LNGKVHVLGGSDGGTNFLAVHEAYDPVGNAWTTATPMNAARYVPFVATDGTNIYAGGGILQGGAFSNTFQVYGE
jgi:hypothetical protein